MMGGFIINFIFVGVGEFTRMRGGICMMVNPPGVAEGGAAATCVLVRGTAVGTIGVGGATIDAKVSGMQAGVVTEPATQAKPPVPAANSIYHHEPSELLPATLAVPP